MAALEAASSQPLEGRFTMPENEETEQSVEEPQVTETAPEADGSEEEPFDRKRAEAALKKKNSEAENLRKRLKELEPLAAKAKELEDAQKTETERLNEQLTAQRERAEKAVRAAVASKVEALARDFADPEDAVGSLDLTAFVDEDGVIDTDAIKDALADLLKRKPHWARPDEGGPRRPAPDRTQGSSGNGNRSPSDPAQVFAGLMEQALKGR
jgi:molecular chaperone GrpE (heat shock protein)